MNGDLRAIPTGISSKREEGTAAPPKKAPRQAGQRKKPETKTTPRSSARPARAPPARPLGPHRFALRGGRWLRRRHGLHRSGRHGAPSGRRGELPRRNRYPGRDEKEPEEAHTPPRTKWRRPQATRCACAPEVTVRRRTGGGERARGAAHAQTAGYPPPAGEGGRAHALWGVPLARHMGGGNP